MRRKGRKYSAKTPKFVIEAVDQLEKRLVGNDSLVKNPHLFKPDSVLCQMSPNFIDLPLAFHDFIQNEDINKIKRQYEKLLYVNWKGESKLNNEMPSEPIEFW